MNRIGSRVARRRLAYVVAALGVVCGHSAIGLDGTLMAQQPAAEAPSHLGALAPANRAKKRPAAPFDLTGIWLHANAPDNPFRFAPPAGFTLTPEAQVHYDAARKAQAESKVYRDDIGQCWPAGMPLIMTRVWPIAMMQYPTAIYMVSEFMNSMRVIYLDGRGHADPDVVVRSWNGESIGHWEGETLVIDTRNFVGHHHWIDSGIPASDALRIVERVRMINDGKTLQIDYTLTDPKSFAGEWKYTKRWNRVDDRDIAEVTCLPELNEHMPTTRSGANVR